jgi:hypothetical protein
MFEGYFPVIVFSKKRFRAEYALCVWFDGRRASGIKRQTRACYAAWSLVWFALDWRENSENHQMGSHDITILSSLEISRTHLTLNSALDAVASDQIESEDDRTRL